MKRILTFVVLMGFAVISNAADVLDQVAFPQISAQPIDQSVPLGGNAVPSVESTNSDSYQWLRNGAALAGQTNSSLILYGVTTNDAAYYSCVAIKGLETVPTRAATLDVYIANASGDQIVIYGTPVLGSGNQGSCPGVYVGYVNFTKSVSQGWGWAPSTNTTIHTASDLNRNDTKVVYVGKNGDYGCDQTSVAVPDPTYSPKYRFTIYFASNVPTNAYPITLSGFDP